MFIRQFKCLVKSSFSYQKVKGFFDIIFSALIIIIFLPLWVIIAVLVKLTSKGRVIFKHKRLGLRGIEFEVYKFRTMVEDAFDHTQFFSPDQIAEYSKNYKLKNDPRITPLGKFLRRTSIDEIPQFINVFRREMSVIGPRPVTKEELSRYGDSQELLLSVKPGITGLWQISGRSHRSYDERVKLDIKYINELSFMLDFCIFFKTLVSVIKRDGAY